MSEQEKCASLILCDILHDFMGSRTGKKNDSKGVKETKRKILAALEDVYGKCGYGATFDIIKRSFVGNTMQLNEDEMRINVAKLVGIRRTKREPAQLKNVTNKNTFVSSNTAPARILVDTDSNNTFVLKYLATRHDNELIVSAYEKLDDSSGSAIQSYIQKRLNSGNRRFLKQPYMKYENVDKLSGAQSLLKASLVGEYRNVSDVRNKVLPILKGMSKPKEGYYVGFNVNVQYTIGNFMVVSIRLEYTVFNLWNFCILSNVKNNENLKSHLEHVSIMMYTELFYEKFETLRDFTDFMRSSEWKSKTSQEKYNALLEKVNMRGNKDMCIAYISDATVIGLALITRSNGLFTLFNSKVVGYRSVADIGAHIATINPSDTKLIVMQCLLKTLGDLGNSIDISDRIRADRNRKYSYKLITIDVLSSYINAAINGASILTTKEGIVYVQAIPNQISVRESSVDNMYLTTTNNVEMIRRSKPPQKRNRNENENIQDYKLAYYENRGNRSKSGYYLVKKEGANWKSIVYVINGQANDARYLSKPLKRIDDFEARSKIIHNADARKVGNLLQNSRPPTRRSGRFV